MMRRSSSSIAVVAVPFRDGLLGGVLHGRLWFRHPLLDRMAQPGNLECGHSRRSDAGISAGGAPVIRHRPGTISPRRLLEAAFVGAALRGAGILRLRSNAGGCRTRRPRCCTTPIPLLIWAALRFGLGGISAAMLVVTFQAIWGTMRGHGPFLAPNPGRECDWRCSCSSW